MTINMGLSELKTLKSAPLRLQLFVSNLVIQINVIQTKYLGQKLWKKT